MPKDEFHKPCAANFPDMFLKDVERVLAPFAIGSMTLDPGEFARARSKNLPFYRVREGFGLLTRRTAQNDVQAINVALPDEYVGITCSTEPEHCPRLQAVTPMVIELVDPCAMAVICREHPGMAMDLVHRATQGEHFLSAGLAAYGAMTAEKKLAWGLQEYRRRCVANGLSEADACPFPFRQQDLADMLCLSLVHTNKTLRKLRDRGAIELLPERLTIKDYGPLEEILKA